MNRQILNRCALTLLFITGTFAFGCITPARRGPAVPEAAPPSASPIPSQDLELKIAELNQMLASDDLDEYQRDFVLNLISLYEKIRQGSMDCPEAFNLVLEYLEEVTDSFLKKTGGGTLHKHIIRQFSVKRRQIFDNYLYGNYQGVIDGAIELETTYGADALTPEIGLAFAVSLAKKGMLEEALGIASKILPKLEGKPDMVHLRAYMIEWQLGMGERGKALQIYEKLLDNIDERKGLLTLAQRNLALKSDDMTSRTDRPIQEKPRVGELDMEITSLDQLISEVARLIADNEYQQAKILLVRRRLKTQDEAEINLLDQAFQRVEQAEADYRVQIQSGAVEEDPLRVAKNLIDVEEFERAIETIDALDGDESVSPEAAKLKLQATEGLINRERNRAAKLFLMSKNTQDPVKKKDYLVSSHTILKHLVDKYPLSPLNKKVKDNMDTVENEMKVLGIFPE